MIFIEFAEFEIEKVIMARADHDADIVEFITDLAKTEEIEAGIFTAMGALKNARLGYYDQEVHEYQELKIDEHCEIASCVGNISILEGEPFVHSHAVLSYEDGETVAGHLNAGRVFASEIHVQVVDGPKVERKHDNVTDLSLWKFG